ncbi:glycerol-3-phosphate dehydrogenase, anaerobic, A subunit [Desulfofundulus kuznetsovii DSM 6115]|uniref:Glycerol-3-phosphate dehydrogenase, anaerobic, A subunit n=1 Tax=Desulfofundulus kuznetsovii (strain DSM 6115 / VKM B-1805 / 17) TaxID=760568 RepID=A0AAU8PHK1_DESK7|nr:glycerol-3-phosphate dehydrogenase, anaerobic, A subunit [Desulfofundulus kuznetsovii DSM 6115]
MIKRERAQVAVVGGGATGVGVLRDLAMRGVDVVLVEQFDLGHGTSSRFHGLLHSGARYAVKDMDAAVECIRENEILKQIAPACVEDTGGLFVHLDGEDPDYVGRWVSACRAAGIDVQEVDVQDLRARYPGLSPRVRRAFRVPDGAVDGFRLLRANVRSARRHGARVFTYHRVTGVHIADGRVTGVELTNTLTGEKSHLECQVLVNAAGPWAGKVAELAGLKVSVLHDKGTLAVFNHRFVNQVINRLRPPGDGDIFVPHNTVTILGTTSQEVAGPAFARPAAEEVQQLLATGEEVFPGLRRYRLIRAFAGVRPLYRSGTAQAGREVSRNFVLLDHREDGLNGMVSIVGGKLTTYRLMAEKTADLVCSLLCINSPCRTAQEPLTEPIPPADLNRGRRLFGFPAAVKAAERWGSEFKDILQKAGADPSKAELICECELVSRAEIEHAAGCADTFTLCDIRRKTRMGMGTCQGAFCAFRTLGVAAEHNTCVLENNLHYLREFLQSRWEGIRPVLWGQQLRETQLAQAIYGTIFNLERMCRS